MVEIGRRNGISATLLGDPDSRLFYGRAFIPRCRSILRCCSFGKTRRRMNRPLEWPISKQDCLDFLGFISFLWHQLDKLNFLRKS